jgi:hypothetical protein
MKYDWREKDPKSMLDKFEYILEARRLGRKLGGNSKKAGTLNLGIVPPRITDVNH